MASFQQLPSGKWRVQVRKAGLYRAATFDLKRDAVTWATSIEAQAQHVAAGGYAPPPKAATLGALIDEYNKATAATKRPGRTKVATLAMLKREFEDTKLVNLSAMTLRDFIDRRQADKAGGVTIAADLSYLSAVLKWARHARQIDVNDRLALDARASLKHRGLNTRGVERDREPTAYELEKLIAHWQANKRQKIPMIDLCRFALATAMRLGEITSIRVEDVDREAHTVVIRDRKDPRNKHGNDQKVPLLPDAWALVEPAIKGRDTGRVFPFSADSVSTAFTRTCATLEIKNLHFHDLRHAGTANLFRMGLDIPQVALMTGHKTWAMLRRYTAVQPADVLKKLNEKTAKP